MSSVVPVWRQKDILSLSSLSVSSNGCSPRKAGQPSGVKTSSDTRQHSDESLSGSLINSEDYHYIMSTSVSNLVSSSSQSNGSPRRGPQASFKTQARVDISIYPEHYKSINDASSSDVSSSPSHERPREADRASASSAKSYQRSPRESARASDNADACYNTSPPPPSPSPVPRSSSGSGHSVWSSEILDSFSSSDSESVFDPFVEDDFQPRLSSREPSVDVQFPVAETISEISLANNSEESWFTGSRESNSLHQEEFRIRKMMLDQCWVYDRQRSMSDWLSSVHVWEEDVASNLGTESLLTRIKTRLQSTWWRLTRRRETRVQNIMKSSSGNGGGTNGRNEDKTPRREKLQKRVQSFISRVFICGGVSQA